LEQLRVEEIATACKNFILDNVTEARQRLAFFSFLVTFFSFVAVQKRKK
jgi:hypothetical protein